MRSSDSIPQDIESDASQYSEQLIELIAETDDNLVNKYLEGNPLTPDEISQGLKTGIHNNSIVPILFGSSTEGIGIEELLDFISSNLPSPKENLPIIAKNAASGNEIQLDYDSDGDFSAIVFKTTADPFVGKLSYFKVLNGTLSSDTPVWNVSKETNEKIAQPFTIRGKDQEPIDSVVAGDIGAVSKLNTVLTNDYLATENNPITLLPIQFPQPIYQMAVSPKSRADVDKMTSSLSRIGEEDPTLKIIKENFSNNTKIFFIKNFSKGFNAAIISGFRNSSAQATIIFMADDHTNHNLIDLCYEKFSEGYDVVCPSRFIKGGKMIGNPILKALLTRLVSFFLYYFTSLEDD